MPDEIPEYRSGTGKVIAVGDRIRVDRKGPTYVVKKLTENGNGVEAHCWGGKPNHERFRTFLIQRCSRVLKPTTR